METIISYLTSNRVKSFLWRSGMMTLSYLFAVLVENLGLLQLEPGVIAVLGLVLGEVSKYFNSKAKTV
jgi:hypothetical protein